MRTIEEWKIVEKDGNIEDELVESQTSLKWIFLDSRWKNPNFMYFPMLGEFFRECKRFYL